MPTRARATATSRRWLWDICMSSNGNLNIFPINLKLMDENFKWVHGYYILLGWVSLLSGGWPINAQKISPYGEAHLGE
jgi:hypothetical protein